MSTAYFEGILLGVTFQRLSLHRLYNIVNHVFQSYEVNFEKIVVFPAIDCCFVHLFCSFLIPESYVNTLSFVMLSYFHQLVYIFDIA